MSSSVETLLRRAQIRRTIRTLLAELEDNRESDGYSARELVCELFIEYCDAASALRGVAAVSVDEHVRAMLQNSRPACALLRTGATECTCTCEPCGRGSHMLCDAREIVT